jgi:CDP-diacylglycerol--glycerol-3-phosphate 3-phosphatidyltransferase
MLHRFKAFWTNLFKPIANLLIRLGVSPDAVTVVGTVGVSASALYFYPRGEFFVGTAVITCFVFSDMLDGYMARTLGVSSKWGAFLDSTLDRLGDAAVFSGLAIWFFRGGDNHLLAYVALWVLVMGSVTSYARARAESLGMVADVGIAERSDRLVSALLLTGLSGLFDWPILIAIALWGLAAATTVTVVQRMLLVRRQALADPTLPS